MIDSAIQYIDEGLGALPLNYDKTPKLPAGHNYLYQLISENDVDRLFLKADKIGIACGKVSDGLEAIDFDAHDGENIRKIFNEFVKDDGVSTIIDANNLPIVKTPSKGYHIYFKSDSYEGSRKLAKWENGNTMIETRGDGGYVATIPSEGYELLNSGDIIKLGKITEDERDYLFATAEALSQQKIEAQQTGSGKWPVKFNTTTLWGRFNEEGVDEAKDLLIDAGWEHVRDRKHDGVQLWCRPGKDTIGNRTKPTSATFGKLRNMFYVFSSNASPFSEMRGYTPFSILLILKFGNDKAKTIEYLKEKYEIVAYKPKVQKNTINFPINVLPEIVRNYIVEQNEISNFDINLMASTYIWLASSMIGNRFRTRVNDNWDVSPVTWLMIIAERGSTKTHAINAIISSAKKLDNFTRKAFEIDASKYDKLTDKEKKNQDRPKWKQMFLEDGTREGYIKAMKHNPTGLGLMKDELTGWIADMDRHSGTKGGDEAFWLSSFNNTSYTKNIKGDDGSHVDRMFINLAGSIQPQLIDQLVKQHSINGLFDRFLLVPYIEKQFKFSMKKPEFNYHPEYERFINFFMSVMGKFPDGSSFNFFPDAQTEFEKYYNKFLKIKYANSDPSLSAYIAKIITYLPRLSLIIDISDQIFNIFSGKAEYIEANISADSVIKAYDILSYFLNNAKNLLFDIGEKQDINDILKASGAIKRSDKAIILLKSIEKGEINMSKASIARLLNVGKQYISNLESQRKVQKEAK